MTWTNREVRDFFRKGTCRNVEHGHLPTCRFKWSSMKFSEKHKEWLEYHFGTDGDLLKLVGKMLDKAYEEGIEKGKNET